MAIGLYFHVFSRLDFDFRCNEIFLLRYPYTATVDIVYSLAYAYVSASYSRSFFTKFYNLVVLSCICNCFLVKRPDVRRIISHSGDLCSRPERPIKGAGADPVFNQILKGRPRRNLTQMHTMNYTRFIREKATY